MTRPPDAKFTDPRLAELYDVFDDDRSDLDVYERLIAELGARRVLDIGCGTGSLAVRLVGTGIEVTGVDPAKASVDIARTKPGAELVTWIHGDAPTVAAHRPAAFDLAIMTGNVAQVFVDDEEWTATLGAAAELVRSGGFLVFETRDPANQQWLAWTPERTETMRTLDDAVIVHRMQVTSTALPLVTFRATYTWPDGTALTSTSTLCFRGRDEIVAQLDEAGFDVTEVRDAPDRPGKEFVFIAQRR